MKLAQIIIRISSKANKDTHREKAPNKYVNLGSWYIKLVLCNRFLNWNKIFKKKVVTGCDWSIFVLTLASDRAVVYGNGTFSILVLSTKNGTLFFEKVFVFQEICFKGTALKTFPVIVI